MEALTEKELKKLRPKVERWNKKIDALLEKKLKQCQKSIQKAKDKYNNWVMPMPNYVIKYLTLLETEDIPQFSKQQLEHFKELVKQNLPKNKTK